jgi:hypothetical protein
MVIAITNWRSGTHAITNVVIPVQVGLIDVEV